MTSCLLQPAKYEIAPMSFVASAWNKELPYLSPVVDEYRFLKKKRVAIALSGGVDSSVAALILKLAGAELVGLTMRLGNVENLSQENVGSKKSCCSYEDMEDARRVCELLEIPYYGLNFTKHFKEYIIEPFVESYLNGQTPSPCVKCNNHLKFNELSLKTKQLTCEYLATGHYAQKIALDGSDSLVQAVDSKKDQTYFLNGISQEELSHSLFPLGKLYKTQVREIAAYFGLPNHSKKESQEICFVPNQDYAGFIKRYTRNDHIAVGNFIDSLGNVLGKHEGIIHYTVGQRKGIGIAGSEPYYVLEIRKDSNEIVIGNKSELACNALIAKEINWIIPPEASFSSMKATVKIRYRDSGKTAHIQYENITKTATLTFEEPVYGVTPGQAVVFYRDNHCLGGGWIVQPLK